MVTHFTRDLLVLFQRSGRGRMNILLCVLTFHKLVRYKSDKISLAPDVQFGEDSEGLCSVPFSPTGTSGRLGSCTNG